MTIEKFRVGSFETLRISKVDDLVFFRKRMIHNITTDVNITVGRWYLLLVDSPFFLRIIFQIEIPLNNNGDSNILYRFLICY
jgi:hypothetical protein